MRDEVINKIEREKIIAIVRGVGKEKVLPLAQALYDGGIRLMEVTYDSNGKVSDSETANKIKILTEHFKDKILIGAGTVLSAEQVELTHDANGTFIISPNVDGDVIKATRRFGMVSIPGALTPTEIQEAHRLGADFVKMFPITNMGPEYVKAVKAPLSHIKLLAVGGIDENNITDYLNVGVQGFGVGSNIIDKKLLEDDNYEAITALAKKYTEKL